MRISNALQMVTGSCQSLRLAYADMHLSIEIVYSDLPPVVRTSLNSKGELLWKIENPRPRPRSSRRDPLPSASEESASHHVSFPYCILFICFLTSRLQEVSENPEPSHEDFKRVANGDRKLPESKTCIWWHALINYLWNSLFRSEKWVGVRSTLLCR